MKGLLGLGTDPVSQLQNRWIDVAKNQGPNSKDEQVISLPSLFRNRQKHIVAYRGNFSNQGPKSRDMKLFLTQEMI